MTDPIQIARECLEKAHADISGLLGYLGETLEHWDKDQDAKVGKRLNWLAGFSHTYEPDRRNCEAVMADIRTALAALSGITDTQRLDWLERQCVVGSTIPQFWRNRNNKISFAPYDEAKVIQADTVRAAIDAAMTATEAAIPGDTL